MNAPIRQMLSTLLLALLLAPLAHADAAKSGDEVNPHLWKPRVKSVAVFKNGFGFFMREGKVQRRDGWAVAREIPPATFGTLAIYSLNPAEVVDVVGSGPGEVVEFDGVDAPKEIAAKRARLEGALKLNVQLTYTYRGSERTAAGKLVSVGEEFAVLDSGGNSFAAPVEGISRLQILDLPLRIHVASDDGPPAAEAELGMAYLREGITWIPEYSLRVVDETTAELTLRGTLVNEAEDLVHADVHFVVGVPHFAHTGHLAPVAVGQVIRTIGAAVAPTAVASQIMSRAAIANNAAVANQFDGTPGVVDQPVEAAAGLGNKLGNLPQLDSPGGSDFTVYTKQDLTLRRGERAIVTLFVKKLHYSHIYRWNAPQPMQHFLTLQNETETAWTTGPCLALSENRPLSEDLIHYTPKGGKAELPITTAVNVAHEQSESESDRKFKAHSPAPDVFYDLVTLSGQLKLKNFEKTPTEIAVEASVPGKPVAASDEGERSADSSKLQLLDRSGTIRWHLKLGPGEAKTLTYQYERYVKSN